jgi:hypothetical protein
MMRSFEVPNIFVKILSNGTNFSNSSLNLSFLSMERASRRSVDMMRVASLQQLRAPAQGRVDYERRKGGGRWYRPASSGAGSARLRQGTEPASNRLRGETRPTKYTGSRLRTAPELPECDDEAERCAAADAADSTRWPSDRNAMKGFA